MPEIHSDTAALTFRRNREKDGFWQSRITYSLAQAQRGVPLGELVLQGRNATFSSASRRDDFRLRQNFWGTRWVHAGDGGVLFGRYRWGFLRPSFEFADGARYIMSIRRKWRFSSEPAVTGNLHALFTAHDITVMELVNKIPLGFFRNEVRAPLEGSINTSITELQKIAGLLMFFQAMLEARNRSSH